MTWKIVWSVSPLSLKKILSSAEQSKALMILRNSRKTFYKNELSCGRSASAKTTVVMLPNNNNKILIMPTWCLAWNWQLQLRRDTSKPSLRSLYVFASMYSDSQNLNRILGIIRKRIRNGADSSATMQKLSMPTPWVPSGIFLSASQEGPNEITDARRERQLQSRDCNS